MVGVVHYKKLMFVSKFNMRARGEYELVLSSTSTSVLFHCLLSV